MNIVVCIKQVPDSPSVKVDRKRMTIIREGVESVINPMDYVALESALELKSWEGGEVTVMTMGPPQSEEALRECLAAGADKAYLLSDPAFAGGDTLATSLVLSTAILKLETFPDLVLCGMQTTDSDTGHVGPQIAEELGLPQVCGITEIYKDGNKLVVERVSDGFLDTIEVSLPALLTVTSGLRPVRYLALGSLEKAFSHMEITRWGLNDLGLDPRQVGLDGSATQVWKLLPPMPRRTGEKLDGSPQILVDSLIRKLKSLNILDEEDGV